MSSKKLRKTIPDAESKSNDLKAGDQAWLEVEEMGRGRYYLMCGKVKAGDGGSVEVVAAGGSDDAATSLDVVEIFSVGAGTWRDARPLPLTIYGASVVQLEDTFLIVGGYREGWSNRRLHIVNGRRIKTASTLERFSHRWKVPFIYDLPIVSLCSLLMPNLRFFE